VVWGERSTKEVAVMYSENALAHERHQRRQDEVAAIHLAAAAKRAAHGDVNRRGGAHLVARAGTALRRLVGTRPVSRVRTVTPTTSMLRRA